MNQGTIGSKNLAEGQNADHKKGRRGGDSIAAQGTRGKLEKLWMQYRWIVSKYWC